MPSPSPIPQFLTYRQVATILGVSERTIKARVASGELPAVHIGHSRRIPAIWLDIMKDAAILTANARALASVGLTATPA